MDVSIVIVSYNTCDLLGQCLRSIYSLKSDLEIEVVVVDNASSDGSQEMCKVEFTEVDLIENSENNRYAIANNQGWQVTSGRNILFLNSDTIVLDGAIEAMSNVLDTNDMAGGCSCKLLNDDGSLQRNLKRDPTLINQMYCDTLFRGMRLIRQPWSSYQMKSFDYNGTCAVGNASGAVLMVKIDILEKTGGMDEGFPFYFEDTDMCRKVWESGSELWYTAKGQIVHLGGGSSESDAMKPELKYFFYFGLLRYLRKYYGKNKTLLFCLFWKPLVVLMHLWRIIWNSLRCSIYNLVGKKDHQLTKKYSLRARTSGSFLMHYFLKFIFT